MVCAIKVPEYIIQNIMCHVSHLSIITDMRREYRNTKHKAGIQSNWNQFFFLLCVSLRGRTEA